MPTDHPGRLARAADTAGAAGLDALIVAPSADLVYLSGYDPPPLPRLTCLVVRPGASPTLVVPRLERPLADGSGAGELAEVVSWEETDDPYELVRRILGDGVERVGCSDRMWASHVLRLQAALDGATFGSASEVLARLRAVKDPEEIDMLKRAARYADEVFGRLLQTRLETRTERQIARQLADLLLETGSDEVTFTIVGAGPNAASPHHAPTAREIHHGDAVVLDFGARVDRYCSDISRTVVVGKPPREFGAVYEAVREAQEEAIQAVRPGVAAEDVDRAAREVIERAGYGDLFVHRTGHGIGLDEHEAPYIVGGNRELLQPGMCFSVEPGVYLSGEFGVRIEDIVTVTEDGCQRLNHAGRDMEVVR